MSRSQEQSDKPVDSEIQTLLDILAPKVLFVHDEGTTDADTEEGGFVDTFYWPEDHKFDATGTLIIAASYYQGASHASGVAICEPTHPDYPFWVWVIRERKYSGLVSEDEVQRLKQEFQS